jgi:hypothetical protein
MKTALVTVLVVLVFAGLFILSLCPWRPRGGAPEVGR